MGAVCHARGNGSSREAADGLATPGGTPSGQRRGAVATGVGREDPARVQDRNSGERGIPGNAEDFVLSARPVAVHINTPLRLALEGKILRGRGIAILAEGEYQEMPRISS